MTLPVFNKGTRPSAHLYFVNLVSGSWTQIWAADDTRSFAVLIGGTGVEGESVFVTDDPLLSPGDPGVAEFAGIRGAAYFETRGTNPLWARTNIVTPLAVRISTATQVAKVPLPTLPFGTKNYKVTTRVGGGVIDYIGGVTQGLYAPVLPYQEDRIRATILGDQDLVMVAANFNDPGIVNLLVPTQFMSSGPAFPGTLAIEGVDAISLMNIGSVGEQTSAWWIADYMEPLP